MKPRSDHCRSLNRIITQRSKAGIKARTAGMGISSLPNILLECLQYFRQCAGSGIITVSKNNALLIIMALEESEQKERDGG